MIWMIPFYEAEYKQLITEKWLWNLFVKFNILNCFKKIQTLHLKFFLFLGILRNEGGFRMGQN